MGTASEYGKNKGQKKQKHVKQSKARDNKFFGFMEEGLSAIDAAQKAGYGHTAVYKRRQTDTTGEYIKRWDAAYEMGIQVRLNVSENEADRRAIEGVEEPVYQKGKLVGKVRKFSDALLMFRIKKLNPAYRDRVELKHSGEIDNPSAGVAVLNITLNGEHSDGGQPLTTSTTE